MDTGQLRAALQTIHTRWEHGHDGLTTGCALCTDERAELAALTAVAHALRSTQMDNARENPAT